ncbi:1-phosphofructokinase [Extibacter muris]|uniref:1-phosphofructokinase n=1 Tax=Extibacter muris TaxID=1796622 RepID=UPI001D0766B2|nr:1-phosphofructokinase [Extibacter muris]MCB6201697.1 1-phosphofructokinase [Extibacter muris]MCQ4663023.1 1-phosphofructokinase [Extibacter muris]MCQ4693289.1 1-phosphofructokinase [Extibacter muris]
MIYTVTFNPSLDYVIQTEKLTPGEINRTADEHIYPGGKGNNVSVILSNLGLKSRALGFVAGFTGDALEHMLNSCGCHTDFIRLEKGFTRINVKINDGQETEINGQGPSITEEALQELYGRLDGLEAGDFLVLAGSIPDTMPPDIYEKIMARLDGREIHIAVDATKELLLNVLKYQPFLIKPNNHELGEMFGTVLDSEEEIIRHARMLQEKGARNVLVSMAGDGAILLTEEQTICKGRPPKGEVKNSVGAGDSMVAGFLTGWLNTGDYEKAFKLGIAAGSATAFTNWLAEKEEIVALLGEEPPEYGL